MDVFLTSDNTKNPLIALMPTPIDSGSDQSETDDSSMNTSNEHFNIEEEEEEDGGDSDVSEERNQEDFAEEKLSQARLPGAIDSQQPSDAVSLIFNSFNNRKTFSCPKIKTDFVTGTDIADLSPEDVGMIAAMGDSLAKGNCFPHIAAALPKVRPQLRGGPQPEPNCEPQPRPRHQLQPRPKY
ncbi:unnamed protein product [Anisakis simplex]|uniref:Lysophospholipase n=1 Tax=Anisakis simplex TaxID=6269 RepID=A0A0M3JUH4_ANISI|nr:unnamed protein product [Anisakis simplex]